MSNHREVQVLDYIDSLDQTRVASLFDYTAQISKQFDLDEAEAKTYIRLWLKTFSERYLAKQASKQLKT